MSSTTTALSAFGAVGVGVIRVITGQTGVGLSLGAYRPPQWSQPALTMITVPPAYVLTPSTHTDPTFGNTVGATSAEAADPSVAGTFTMSVTKKLPPPNTAPLIYVLDAVFRTTHSQMARPTQHPIQTGSNISDHIILDPAHLTMEVGMSDAMDSYTAGQWQGNSSKSVNCFQILSSLRAARVPLTITTRLQTYTNMFITNIRPDESVKTRHALRASIEFQQLFIATVAVQGTGARPQTTDSTSLGPTQTASPSSGTVANNQLPSTTTGAPSSGSIQSRFGAVIGAGKWSSNNTSALASTYSP